MGKVYTCPVCGSQDLRLVFKGFDEDSYVTIPIYSYVIYSQEVVDRIKSTYGEVEYKHPSISCPVLSPVHETIGTRKEQETRSNSKTKEFAVDKCPFDPRCHYHAEAKSKEQLDKMIETHRRNLHG